VTTFDLVAAFFAALTWSHSGDERMVPPPPLAPDQRQMVPPAPLPTDVTAPAEPALVMKVIPVKGLNLKKLCKAFTTIYGDRPGFKIDAIKDVCIIIRGDEKTVEQIIEIVNYIRPLGSDK
jgi:hypothetical protein